MHLIQLLLPLADNDGHRFPPEVYAATHAELTGRFGGLTTYTRAPAAGLWRDAEGDVQHDDVVIFEVMTDALDREWWAAYRATLERRFRQDAIVARAIAIDTL